MQVSANIKQLLMVCQMMLTEWVIHEEHFISLFVLVGYPFSIFPLLSLCGPCTLVADTAAVNKRNGEHSKASGSGSGP